MRNGFLRTQGLGPGVKSSLFGPDMIAGRYEIRAEMELVPGTLGNFLETDTRVAQKGIALINLSQNFFFVYISCTMDGETRRLGYQSFCRKHVVCVISVTIRNIFSEYANQ